MFWVRTAELLSALTFLLLLVSFCTKIFIRIDEASNYTIGSNNKGSGVSVASDLLVEMRLLAVLLRGNVC